jgi:CHAT domain-containing protein
MSLWAIPDKETVEFMGLFYNNLLKAKDIREAFSETQKAMRAKYDQHILFHKTCSGGRLVF